MKSQGLPINFIVLAAVAILILILIVGFVIGGGTAIERGITPGVARTNCDRWCSDLQVKASRSVNDFPFIANENRESSFCMNTQVVEGSISYCNRENLNEGESSLNYRCLLTFRDGSSRYAICFT